MKKHEKEVEKFLLSSEKEVREQIKKDYAVALRRVNAKIAELTEEFEKNPELRSKIYQRQYQEKLRTQLETALSGLSDKTFDRTLDYLKESYQDAFVGANYNIKAEGYDLFIPYNQQRMINAIYNTTEGFKLSKSTYDGNIAELQKKLQSELSRGLNSDMDYGTISRLAPSKTNISYNQTKRIIATEGHRVQNEAKMDCMSDAKKAGADIVKEWNSTMDAVVRERHAILDGQIRELEDAFTALGADTQYPGGFGIASEDINCRCCLLQRARWTLNDEQKKQLESYRSFREHYQENMNKLEHGRLSRSESESDSEVLRIDIGSINMDMVDKAVEYFNESIRLEPVENCIIIQKDGKVIQFVGSVDSVNFDNVKISGSYVLHNHIVDMEHAPVSFGKDDFEFLKSTSGLYFILLKCRI